MQPLEKQTCRQEQGQEDRSQAEELEHLEFGLPRRFHSSWQYDPPQDSKSFLSFSSFSVTSSLVLAQKCLVENWEWVSSGQMKVSEIGLHPFLSNSL